MESKNPYYDHAMAGLIETTKKRREIEKNFDRSRRQEYDLTCENQLLYGAELLKLGSEYEIGPEVVSVLMDTGEIVEFTKDEMEKTLGEKTFELLLNQQSKEKNPVASDNEEQDDFEDELLEEESLDNKRDVEYSVPDKYYRNMVYPFLSPLFQAMQMMVQPLQYAPTVNQGKSVNSDHEDPIVLIREEIDNLKKSKSRIKKKAAQYKADYEELKKNFDELVRENEELDAVATDNRKTYEGEKAELLNELEEKKKVIEDAESDILEKEKRIRSLEENVEQLNKQNGYYLQQINDGKEKAAVLKNQLEQKEKSLLEQKRITEEQAEKAHLAEKRVKEEIEKTKAAEAKVNAMNKQVADAANQIQAVKSKESELVNQMQEEIREKENVVSAMEKERKKVTDLTTNVQEAEKKAKIATEEATEARKREREQLSKVDTLTKENEELNRRIQEMINEREKSADKQTERHQEEKQQLKEHISTLEMEKKRIEEDKASLKKELEALSEELDKCRQEKEAMLKEHEKVKEEATVLREVAYTSGTFDIENEKAFDRDYYNNNRKIRLVATVDVCDMRKINSEYKEEIGDKVIRLAIEALEKEFGKGNVYRIRGAQFAVIIMDGDYSNTRDLLEKVRNDLMAEQEFEIVYGIANLKKYSFRKKDAYNAARSNMEKMKQKRDEKLIRQENAEMIPDVTSEQAENTEQYERNVENEVTLNPNISSELLKDDEYGDDSTAKEIDATSIDLAAQIMGMVNNQ